MNSIIQWQNIAMERIKMNQRKIGIILSYLYIILNSVIGIFFTPFLLSKLGNAEYGLYQLVQSISSYLVIANCGTGTAMTKFVSQFRAQKDKKSEDNYVFHNMVVATLFMILIGTIGFSMLLSLSSIFPNFTNDELSKAKVLFIILVLNIMLSTYTNAFAGYAIAHEKYVFTNGWGTARIVLRVLAIVVLLNLGCDSIAIVSVDFAINVLYILTLIYLCVIKLGMKVKFYYWDSQLLRSTFVFSFAILIQAIVNQVNQNVDKMLLGMLCTTYEVTLYSLAMNFFVVFSQLSTALRSVFLPKITSMIYSDCSNDDLVELSARVGRIQFMIVGAALAGFMLFGKNFMTCWVGSQIGDDVNTAWLIALIIMIPSTVTASNGVCSSILDAKEKRIIGSSVLLIVAIVNMILTFFLIKRMGIIGAPIATAIATVIGSIFLLNLYFISRLRINIIRMYALILKGTLPCLLLTSLICFCITRNWSYGWKSFIFEVFVFLIIYGLLMMKFGLKEEEKKEILGKVYCIKRN